MSKKKNEQPENEPNIVFVGRRKELNPESGKFETVEKDVPESISLIGGKVSLAEVHHGVPFYHERADELKSELPEDFKTPSAK